MTLQTFLFSCGLAFAVALTSCGDATPVSSEGKPDNQTFYGSVIDTENGMMALTSVRRLPTPDEPKSNLKAR